MLNKEALDEVREVEREQMENEKKPSNSALSDGLACLDGIEVAKIDKYRDGFAGVNNDYNRARVVIDLKFPEHLKLYYKLKGMAS